MSTTSTIEWTDTTWNPTTGCDRVSAGCDHCYALTLAGRLKAMGSAKYRTDGDPRTSGPGFGVAVHPDTLDQPLRWREPRMVFVNSMSDLFHDRVPDEFIAAVFAVMALAGRHTFQVLTKRHGRMRHLLTRPGLRPAIARHASDLIASRRWARWQLDLGGQRLAGDSGLGGGWTTTPAPTGTMWTPPWPLPNVWLGVSIEDQKRADLRIPALLSTPAAVRFLSCEPLLGPIELRCALCHRFHGIDWVIAGGESSPGARPVDLAWIRDLVDQTRTAGTAVFVKQLGSVWTRANGGDPKGGDWDLWPPELRIRDYPTTTGRAV